MRVAAFRWCRVLAAALLVAASAGARADSLVSSLRRGVGALHDEDVDTARSLIEPLAASNGDERAVKLALGVLRFYEQRYDESAKLLEEAGGEDVDLYLRLARNARDLTRDYGRHEGEHFVITYPKGKDEVLVPYVLEALEAQRAALEKDLGWVPPGKVTVEFLNDTRALAKVSTLTEEEIKTSGTIALCKFNKLMVVSPKALLQGYDWLDTAAHEYVHYVVTRRTQNNTPIWLHEGIAKWAETRWRGSGGEALSPFSAALLRDAARKDRLITFEEMHPSMAKLPSQEAAALAFAEVMVAVEYLTVKGGPAALPKVLDLVTAGKSAEASVAEALGVPFARFMSEWRRYLSERPLPKEGERELDKLRFKGDPKHGGSYSEWSEIPDEKARGFARLGEIMRARGKLEAARVEYGKAMKLVGARVPVLTGRYAGVAMRTGRDAEAERALAEALDSHPDYPALHIGLGRLYVKRKSWDQARHHLLLANRVDPFDPEIHAGLALAYEALGDQGSASREKRFAQLLAGSGPSHAGGSPHGGGPPAAPPHGGGPLHGGPPAAGHGGQ